MDVRTPVGLLFAILGGILAGYGMASDPAQYQRSLGINVNFWWGLAMFVFGLVLVVLARRGTGSMRRAESSPEGASIEGMERRTGKEI